MPKVTVILSAYNAERYIEESIRSVLNQTFKDFEFFITEDCSIDNTRQIIENIAKDDQRIKLILKNENRGFIGYINNLNEMIRASSCNFIAKFDADDIWEKDKLEIQLNDIKNNSDIFLLSSNAYKIDENNKIIGKIILPSSVEESYKMILRDNPFCHPSILFKNEDYLYREKMYFAEDYDLYLRMFSDGKKLVNRNQFLIKYRILQNSMSRGNKALIQALFKQKAISFYHERVNYGKDSYESFNPDDYLNIFENNHSSSINDLNLALKLSFTSGLQNDFSLLLKKAIKQYNILSFFKFWIISKNFKLTYKIYSKKFI